MKTFYVTLLITAFVLPFGCRAAPNDPQQLESNLILRLPLRAAQSHVHSAVRPNKMKDIGHFFVGHADEDSEIFCGEMLCSDAQGRLYFYDPINPKLALLRCVDRNGYEVSQWKLRTPSANYYVTATPDGYVWVAANSYRIRKGNFPIVVYKFGQAKPLIDWRVKPPFDIDKFVQKTLGQKYFGALTDEQKEKATAWEADFLGASQGKVQLKITNHGVGYSSDSQPGDKKPAITIRWTLTSDGKHTLQRDVYKSPILTSRQQFAANGTQWYFSNDLSLETGKWGNFWLWKKGEQKGQPLLTFEELIDKQSWWQKTFSFDKKRQNPPGLQVDGKGNAYLLFWRNEMLASKGDGAVVILNSQRKPIAYLPWTPSLRYVNKSYFLLPDGSGFYRQEKDDKELRIYFYALPQTKPHSPTT